MSHVAASFADAGHVIPGAAARAVCLFITEPVESGTWPRRLPLAPACASRLCGAVHRRGAEIL